MLSCTLPPMAGSVPDAGLDGGRSLPKVKLPSKPVRNDGIVESHLPKSAAPAVKDMDENRKAVLSRIASNGNTLMGYNAFNGTEFTKGMYRLDLNGNAEYMYTDPYSPYGYVVNEGWIRNGRLCLLVEYSIFTVIDYRYLETDRYTGEVLENREVELSWPTTGFDNYLPLYVSAAYDPTDDTLWGYTCREDGGGYAFFSSPADDVSKTKAVVASEEWNRVCASICYCEKDGCLYGVNRDDNFVRIDREGNQTVLMPIGGSTAYARAAMMYVPEDDYFLWNCQLVDGTTGLWRIDINDLSVTSLVDYESSTSFSVFCTGENEQDPYAVSAPIIDEVDFGLGQNSGAVSFFAPSSYFSGSTFTGEVGWRAYLDGQEVAQGTTQAGKKVTVPFTDLSTGKHTFGFDATFGEKKSPVASTSLYVGPDSPCTPTNVALTKTEVTWDKVIRGVNGGYMDMDNLIYHVYINDEEVGTTGETYYAMSSDIDKAPYAGYFATVVADVAGNLSEASEQSNIITAGVPWDLDVHIAPTVTEGMSFSAVDSNKDGATWHMGVTNDGTACFYDPLSGAAGSDDWLFSPPLNIDDPATDYELSLDIANASSYYRNLTLEVYLCNAIDPAAVVENLIEYKPLQGDTGFNTATQVFSALEPGVYYLAFHTKCNQYESGLRFKNLHLCKTGTSVPRPAVVSDIKAAGAPLGRLDAEIEFSLPMTFISGDEIPADADISVEISSVETSIVTGKPGEKVVVEIPAVQGDNEVTIIPYYNEVAGQRSVISVYCGEDEPGDVQNLTASVTEDNLGMHLTWDAPTEVGANGRYVNLSNLKYIVKYNDGYGWETIAELPYDAREYTFRVEPDNGLHSAWVGVVASNIAGGSYNMPWMSDVLGTPYTPPVFEDFEGGRPFYQPLRMIRVFDENRVTEWNMYNPATILESFANDSGVCLCGSSEAAGAVGMMMLPKFSTEGMTSAGLVINLWTGDFSADMRICGEVYGSDDLIDLGLVPAGSGWTDHVVLFPESMQNQKWISLYLQAYYPSTSSFALVSNYAVRDGVTGSENILADTGDGRIYGTFGQLVVEGHEGDTVRVYTADGRLVREMPCATDMLRMDMGKGLYLVSAGKESSKAVVR